MVGWIVKERGMKWLVGLVVIRGSCMGKGAVMDRADADVVHCIMGSQ